MFSSQMGGNLLKNQKGVRISLESVQKSCRKCPHFQCTFQCTIFKTPSNKGFQTIHRDTEVSSARGGDCHPLFVLGRLTKGFRGFTQQKIRENKTS